MSETDEKASSADVREASPGYTTKHKSASSAVKPPDVLTSLEDCAVGDSDEDDEAMVATQRSATQSRLQRQRSPEELRRKIVPFHWAPMLLPLTAADLDACVDLEQAALRDKNQACSREKVPCPRVLPFVSRKRGPS